MSRTPPRTAAAAPAAAAPRPSVLPTVAAVAAVALAGGALAAFTAITARRVAKALPPEGTFVEVEGARLHVLDRGSGPAIVMIHGLAGQMRHFTHSLAERLEGDHRIVAVDRPGAGWSDAAPGASQSVRAQAAVIAALIRRLGLDRPLVVGHSLGGAVALALALDHPDAVGGLALIAPLTQPVEDAALSPVFRALAIRSPAVRKVVAWTLAVPASMARGAQALETVFAPEPAPADFGTRGGGLLGLRPRSFESSSRDLLAAAEDLPGMTARYPSLTTPVGVLYGDGDRLLDHALHGHGLVAQLPSVDLQVVAGAGHMILMTQPDLTAAFVRRQSAKVERA